MKKIIRPEGPPKKIIRLDLGSAFAHRNLFSHSKIRLSQSEIRLSQSEICFSHSVNYFTHSNSTFYLGNDFLHYKREVFLVRRAILEKILVCEEPRCPPPPPPPHGLMKRALGGLKKNSPARRAGEKNSPALKIGKKNYPAHLSLPAPPP